MVDVQGERAEIRVHDDRAGVVDEDRERIFDRFVSSDGFGGAGLGLAIARMITRAHGGELFYDHGFVLRVPIGSEHPTDSGGTRIEIR